MTTSSKESKARKVEVRAFIKALFGFSPRKTALFEEALRHKSFANENDLSSNERLEYLGDSVLDLISAEYFYYEFPEDNEGELTKKRARLVNRQTLNEVAKKAGLLRVLQESVGQKSAVETLGGNALEAIVGALYLNKGYAYSKVAIMRFLRRYVDLDEISNTEVDFKTRLLEWAQKEKRTIRFEISSNAENDRPVFKAEVYLEDEFLSKGVGSSKKRAEQQAAARAWRQFN